MAQAVFDEHPLEQYLRESGETPELMPGSSAELTVELSEHQDFDDQDTGEAELSDQFSLFWDNILSAFSTVVATYLSTHSDSPFIERFKYDVISSSLLSTSLPVPHGVRPTRTLAVPGGTLSPGHSRTSSVDRIHVHPTSPTLALTTDSHYWISSALFALLIVLYHAGYYLLALLLLPGPIFSVYVLCSESVSKHDMTPSMDSLKELIAASDVWDSAVNEALTVLEKEEQSTLYGATKPSSPPSALRVALQSSLNSTQTQCDNIRQLLMALTSPAELPQLSEMYAPPSPTPSKTVLFPDHMRPMSLTSTMTTPSRNRSRTISSPEPVDRSDKRATWHSPSNGFYSSIANAGSPSLQILTRREKRRSDLSALLGSTGSLSPSGWSSAPSTPLGSISPKLDGVREEEESESRPQSIDDPNNSGGYEQFGSAALDIHRKHRSGGLEVFGFRPRSPLRQSFNKNSDVATSDSFSFPASHSLPHSTVGTPRAQPSSPTSSRSSSRFTTLQTPRHHPLSLSALNHSLNAALAARRYTCSHFLALRFEEETADDTYDYWENVRSVMSLLTSTLADASARLVEALDEAERVRLRDENPSPESLEAHSRKSSLQLQDEKERRKSRTMKEMTSFAPVPSHLTRFAAHVDAISSALNDAREHLEDCVSSLKSNDENEQEEVGEHPALQAYERLRRELGLALRECERGRERLLEITRPPSSLDSSSDLEDDLPVLVPDIASGSEESDKPDSSSSPLDEEGPDHFSIVVAGDGDGAVDDATSHLLLTSSTKHLPPPGIEQVFETEIGPEVPFTRERSKLSREERIRLMKKARVNGKGMSYSGPLEDEKLERRSSLGSGGPSVEVVQELKDVIWKVGERRRKMVATAATNEDGDDRVPYIKF